MNGLKFDIPANETDVQRTLRQLARWSRGRGVRAKEAKELLIDLSQTLRSLGWGQSG
jgi:hypothetical protein